MTHTFHVLLTVLLLSFPALSVEIRVMTGLNMKGMANQPDYGEQKLVLNSNNRYIYPTNQVPEYNTYTLYTFINCRPALVYSRNFI